jgi:hypothetical protein
MGRRLAVRVLTHVAGEHHGGGARITGDGARPRQETGRPPTRWRGSRNDERRGGATAMRMCLAGCATTTVRRAHAPHRGLSRRTGAIAGQGDVQARSHDRAPGGSRRSPRRHHPPGRARAAATLGKTSGGRHQRDDLQVLAFVQRVIHPLSGRSRLAAGRRAGRRDERSVLE